jgi:hypothetical protein
MKTIRILQFKLSTIVEQVNLMIRHCVFINFQDNITQLQKSDLLNKIHSLKSRLPGIITVLIGGNVSPEAGMDKGFSDGFMIDFTTAADRDIYLKDAEHQQIGAELVKSAKGGIAGILVYDIDINT